MPEETEALYERPCFLESRNAFSSPQERTNFDKPDNYLESLSTKKSSLSDCFLLEPQNLTKIFDNQQIIESSETLFTHTGYLTKQYFSHKHNDFNKLQNSILAKGKNQRNVEEVLNDLNIINVQNYNEDDVNNLLEELYKLMEQEGLFASKISSKLKIMLLKSLYRFVESKNENILINIAQIILIVSKIYNYFGFIHKILFFVD